MAVRRCAQCAQNSGVIMRTLVAVNIIAGICLIAFGATVEFPINSFPPIAMILVGVLSIGSALAGMAGSYHRSCCLSCFLVLHGVNLVLQTALVIALFVNLDGVQAAIAPSGAPGQKFDAAYVTHILLAARWLLLLFVLVEMAAFGLALALRFWIRPDGKDIYNNFDESNLQVCLVLGVCVRVVWRRRGVALRARRCLAAAAVSAH